MDVSETLKKIDFVPGCCIFVDHFLGQEWLKLGSVEGKIKITNADVNVCNTSFKFIATLVKYTLLCQEKQQQVKPYNESKNAL